MPQPDEWDDFVPLEMITTLSAAKLVSFAGVRSSEKILDVGAGTGVVAITAARAGTYVSALDLNQSLCRRMQQNVKLSDVTVEIVTANALAIPYPDHHFDVVLSQFGHMFAPDPGQVTHEMLRVLRPGGRIVFSTWPPQHYVGKLFDLVEKYLPKSAEHTLSAWGNPSYIQEMFGNRVEPFTFKEEVMLFPALSLGHYRHRVETSLAPVKALLQHASPEEINAFRSSLETLAGAYYGDNHIHQTYLMAKAVKR